MKVVTVRFVEERDNKKRQEQERVVSRLKERLPERLAEKFPDVEVRVRFSSSAGLDTSGFRDKEKEKLMMLLEEIWDDPFLLDD